MPAIRSEPRPACGATAVVRTTDQRPRTITPGRNCPATRHLSRNPRSLWSQRRRRTPGPTRSVEGCDSFASTATRGTSQSLSRCAPANGSGADCRDRREDCGRLHWRQRVETHSCSREPDAIAQSGRKTVVDEHSRSFTGTRYIGQLGRQLVHAEHPRMSLEKKAKDGTLSEVVVGHRSSVYEHLFVWPAELA